MTRSFFIVLLALLITRSAIPVFGQEQISKEVTLQADTNKIDQLIRSGDSAINIPGRKKADMDNAFSWFNQALLLSRPPQLLKWQNKTMELLSDYYNQNSDNQHACTYKAQLIRNYHHAGDILNEARSWQDLGDYSDNNIRYAHQCYVNSELLFKRSGHKLEETTALKALADNLIRQGKLDSAESALLKVLQQYQDASYKKLYFTFDLLAEVNSLKGYPDKELYYRLATVKNMEETGDYGYAEIYYHHLAVSYALIKDYVQSLFYEKKAVSAGKHYVYNSLDLLTSDLLALRRPGEALKMAKAIIKNHPASSVLDQTLQNLSFGKIYAALGQDQLAKYYYMKAIALYKLGGDRNSLAQDVARKRVYMSVFETVIGYYISTGQFNKARYYMNRIPQIASRSLSPQYQITYNLMQFKIDSAFKDFVPAIRHYELYKKLNDSVFSSKNEKSVEKLQIQYLTTERKQSLKMLKSEQNIANMKVQRADVQRNITLGIVFLASLLAGLSYRGYRRKQLSGILISKKNKQLQLLLKEKDWLLKEVHHRVKNNLHTVSCLLESQSHYLQGDALDAVESSQHRIYAMSLIHQKLYQSDAIQTIDMAVYLPELLQYLKESFGSPDHILFSQRIMSVDLDVAKAISLALITNEAVTNVIKYAFPEGQRGDVQILLERHENEITLTIEDNGVGISAHTDIDNLNSLGIELMRGLTSDLRGKIQFIVNNGTKVIVEFGLEAFAEIEL